MVINASNPFNDEEDSNTGATDSEEESTSSEGDEDSESDEDLSSEEGSSNPFEDDDASSSEEDDDSEDGSEDSDGEFEDEDNGNMNRGFNKNTSDDSEEEDDDVSESGSDSGSESRSESRSDSDDVSHDDYSSEGSSESDDEYGVDNVKSTEQDPFSDESGVLDGDRDKGNMNEGDESSSNNRGRKMYIFGCVTLCCVFIIVAIGLGVGLGLKNKNEVDDTAPENPLAPTPVVPSQPTSPAPMVQLQPTNAPVRMPISLPNPPKIDGDQDEDFTTPTADVEATVDATADTTIYRNGISEDSANSNEDTMLVQNGPPGDSEIASAYSLIEFPLTAEDIGFVAAGTGTATFCWEHVPNNEPTDRVVTYSACLIAGNDDNDVSLDTLTGATATYIMPKDCVNKEVTNFDVSPADTEVCMNVTSLIFASSSSFTPITRGRSRSRSRTLRGGRNNHRSLQQQQQQNFVMMIDNLEQSDEPGDEFYTTNNENSENPPSLLIEGKVPVQCQSIYDIVCSSPQFSLFCVLIPAGGLVETLRSNEQTFTVFAPTNNAFAKIAEDIDMTDAEFVKNLLLYHTVSGEALASNDIYDCALPLIPPREMANGENTNIQCDGDNVFISGDGNLPGELPKVTDVTIGACNGVIHVVDEVILPAAAEECLTFAEFVCSKTELAGVCQLIQMAGSDPAVVTLLDSLNNDGFTFFVPNNEAVQNLEGIDLSDVNSIINVLDYHTVLNDQIFAKDLVCDTEVTMKNGQTTTTVCEGESFFQVGGGNTEELPQIVEADLLTCNGVVHIVDKIIKPGTFDEVSPEVPEVPEAPEAPEDCLTYDELVCSKTELSVLCENASMIGSIPGGSELLQFLSEGVYTFFIPNNEAAASLIAGIDLTDIGAIINIFEYHLIPDSKVFEKDLECDTEVTMKNGQTTTTECAGENFFQVGDGNTGELPQIVETDILTCTGVVHIVNQPILPDTDSATPPSSTDVEV